MNSLDELDYPAEHYTDAERNRAKWNAIAVADRERARVAMEAAVEAMVQGGWSVPTRQGGRQW